MNDRNSFKIIRAKMPVKFQLLSAAIVLSASIFSLNYAWGLLPLILGMLIVSFEDGLLVSAKDHNIYNYFKILWFLTIKRKVTESTPICLTVVHFTELTSKNLTVSALKSQSKLCRVHLILPNRKHITLLAGNKDQLLPQVTEMGKLLNLNVHYSSLDEKKILYQTEKV